MRIGTGAILILLFAWAPAALAGETEKAVPEPTARERIEVTATKYPADPDQIPQSMTILTRKDLSDRGATDLRSALAIVAGIDIAPGGDGGPASAVPEMWGFREFDAYLLIVDGVPWGGAFNPQLATLSLRDIERIEILRGAAPVMYGATSFVGVIQVIRTLPGEGENRVGAAAGSRGSGAVGSSFDLPTWAGFASRLTLDAEKRDYRDERTDFDRGHVLWRNRRALTGGGEVHFNLDGTWLSQDPASPVPRTGAVLASNVPLDANYNPRGAEIDEQRGALSAGFSLPRGSAVWSGIASYARTSSSILRGFITDPTGSVFPATGERSTTDIDEVYLDAHVELTGVPKTQIVAGVDYMYGRGRLRGGEINYTIASDGSHPPDEDTISADTRARVTDTRNFGGAYGYAAWAPNARWRLEGGLRLNITDENRATSLDDFQTNELERGRDSHGDTRLGGSAGVTFTAWSDGPDDLRIFADYRNTYKPAAVDFGLDAESEILNPETSESAELGARAGLFDRKLVIELSAFEMELYNLVVPTVVGGQPALENAGAERFRGFELEATGRLPHDIVLRAAGSVHNARFLDYEREFDGELTQLRGNRQEMTPRYLAGAGIFYAPSKGLIAHADAAFTGSRYLNKRNTALAEQFTTWGMGIGWRADRWEVRLDGTNLGDRRDPVAESELADASYYLLEARRVWLGFEWRF
ncbi:MAG TPA: TonB-dependent receptor plug domain-containing protein [Candidatus Polarisedimenticolia bacterium]|nr:TonB-dependent receptor plug domain-containing protein [Candidatus Polarisedimenticolia bacterium]